MADFEARDPGFEARVRDSFSNMPLLGVLGTAMRRCEPGFVELIQPVVPLALQQHGYIHGGVMATLMDIAGGHAAQTLMGERDSVLTVEFKVNMLAPAQGEALRAEGRVVRSGGTLAVCRMDLFAREGDAETPVCIGQGTYMRMAGVTDAMARATSATARR